MKTFPASVYLPSDAFDIITLALNGRRFLGLQYTRAMLAELQANEELTIICPEPEGRRTLAQDLSHRVKSGQKVQIVHQIDHDGISRMGSIQIMDCQMQKFAIDNRLPHREFDFSITGIIHSLCSKAAINAVASCVGSDLYPWDALVCTSKAGQAVVHQIWQQRLVYLASRMGQGGLNDYYLPETPIIPLPGPSSQVYHPELSRSKRRELARKKLGISREAFCICTVGRLSFHSKSNPVILYRTLDMLQGNKQEIILLEIGQYPNEGTEKAYEELGRCFNRFKKLVIGARRAATEEEKWQAMAASDVFVSLSDNLQETFGLSLQEAMLAELPVVASDWNGYRDIVEHDRTGFLIPTKDVLLSLPFDRYGISFYSGGVDYDYWIGIASLGVSVEFQIIYKSLKLLMENKSLAAEMGEAGLRRYMSTYSPRVVVQQYRDMWQRLAEKRTDAQAKKNYCTGRAPSAQKLFESYPTDALRAERATIIDNEKIEILLSNKITHEFLALLTGSKTREIIQYIKDNLIVRASDLQRIGIQQDQAQRIVALLVKYGIAETRDEQKE